jgi:spoIIIJ-associated protein
MGTSDAPVPARSLASYLAAIEALLQQVIRFAEFELTFSIRNLEPDPANLETPDYVVEFSGPDADLLLEKNGTLLNALEFVVMKAVRLEEDFFGRVTFDCNDFRRLRAEELRLTAQVAAERVIDSGEPFTLNPMSPRERRIIHLALKDHPGVRTLSEGTGPERKVVIRPAAPPPRRKG